MIVDLNLDVTGLMKEIFIIPLTEEDQNKYKEEFAAWEKLPEPRPASPEMPRYSHISVHEMASNMIKNVINASHKVGKTSHLRHILRLNKEINSQIPASSKLILGGEDLAYIRKLWSQHDWPMKDKEERPIPQDFFKLIVLIEEAFKNAKNK